LADGGLGIFGGKAHHVPSATSLVPSAFADFTYHACRAYFMRFWSVRSLVALLDYRLGPVQCTVDLGAFFWSAAFEF
jgi:hypothetical protein